MRDFDDKVMHGGWAGDRGRWRIFQKFIDDYSLIDMISQGRVFTWCNKKDYLYII